MHSLILRTAQAFSFGIANSGGRYEICYCANYDTSERTRRERSYFDGLNLVVAPPAQDEQLRRSIWRLYCLRQ